MHIIEFFGQFQHKLIHYCFDWIDVFWFRLLDMQCPFVDGGFPSSLRGSFEGYSISQHRPHTNLKDILGKFICALTTQKFISFLVDFLGSFVFNFECISNPTETKKHIFSARSHQDLEILGILTTHMISSYFIVHRSL